MSTNKSNHKKGMCRGNATPGRKYHLPTSDMKLPLPIIPMSDFEKHAQRKNRVIQTLHDSELLKIGIDCEASRKFLSCDTRRFYQSVSSNKQDTPENARTELAPSLFYDRKPRVSGNGCKTKIKRRNSSKQNTEKTLAWVPSNEHEQDNSFSDNLNTDAIDANDRTIFLTERKGKENSDQCNRTSRVPPHSAKHHRDKPEMPERLPRRPKSTTAVTRHVTFWDMVAEPITDGKTDPNKKQPQLVDSGSRIKASYRSAKISSTTAEQNIPIFASDTKGELNDLTPASNKAMKNTEYNCSSRGRTLLSTPLSSYLHFNRLQASGELKRELRHNAENRKRVQRRRRLSEMLNTEKNSYEECLTRLSTRLKDQKLLQFCRDSCKGMNNVFEYNL